MGNTYCGKSCAECADREALHCPGCRLGPGRYLTGSCDCPIAKCCNETHTQDCANCKNQEHCFLRKRMTHISETRLHTQRLETKEQIQNSKELSYRLLILGAILVFQFVLASLSMFHWGDVLGSGNETTFDYLDIIIEFLIAVTLLSAGLKSNSLFLRAGIWMLASTILSLIVKAMADPVFWGKYYYLWDSVILIGGILLSLLAAAAGLIAVFHEMYACAEATEPYDPELAAKWRRLWRWYLGLNICFIVLTAFSSFGDYLPFHLYPVILSLSVLVIMAIAAVFYLIRAIRLFQSFCVLNDLKVDSL